MVFTYFLEIISKIIKNSQSNINQKRISYHIIAVLVWHLTSQKCCQVRGSKGVNDLGWPTG